MKRVIWILLLIIFFGHLLFRIGSYLPRYKEKLDGNYWTERYQKSQWVVPNSKDSIGDDGLYAYHGYELIRGGDPTIINPEVPPLGKYIIGIFVIVGNNNLFGLVSGIFALVAFFLLNKALFKDRLLAFLSVVLVSFEPLLYEQLQGSYLDVLLFGMLCLVFYTYLKKNYWLMSLCIGIFASIKFSYLAVFLIITLVLSYWLQTNRKDSKQFLSSFILTPLVLLVSYWQYFLQGHSLMDFLKVQKYIISFYEMGAKPPFIGMVFPMIFLNKWYTWWGGGVIKVPEWFITWPLVFFGTIFSLKYLKKASVVMPLLIWCFFYLVFLLFTPVWPRYLLLLIPILYNLSIWALSQSTSVKSRLASFF